MLVFLFLLEGFHQNAKLPTMFPESCLLIVLGVLASLVTELVDSAASTSVALDPDAFFLFLLPPIVLEAGEFRGFSRNFRCFPFANATLLNSHPFAIIVHCCLRRAFRLLFCNSFCVKALLQLSLLVVATVMQTHLFPPSFPFTTASTSSEQKIRSRKVCDD